MNSFSRLAVVVFSTFPLGWVASTAAGDEHEQLASYFEQEIRPVLASQCIKCHGESKQEGGLRLDSLAGLQAGGDSGDALVSGRPDESLIIEALKYESYEMPPSGQLSEQTIAKFERWIARGAVWPEHTQPLRLESGQISAEDRQWWAFQPLTNPEPPVLKDDEWSRGDIDKFVLARLKRQGMQPAPRAERSMLVRRLYFDVLGVPPSPEELNAFLADDDPHAWENLIDRLLDDNRYGEHWARYWLDLVRYSESDGWNADFYRPDIWRYRDYVVDAFNSDKPYPDFVREQLAGDEIDSDNPEFLVAAGYLRLGIYEYNQRDARSHWDDIINEITDVTGDVFLGLSMSCCRCHDHKFDPLPQQDYYKLRAFFEPLIWRDNVVGATEKQKHEYAMQFALWEDATRGIREQIDALLKPYHDRKWLSTADKFPLDIQAAFYKAPEERTSWEEQMAYLVSRQFMEEGGGPLSKIAAEDKQRLEDLEAELAAFDELKPAPLPTLMTASDHTGAISPTLLPSDPERSIAPGFLAVMSNSAQPPIGSLRRPSRVRLVGTSALRSGTSGRRTALAEWIGDANNALTTRVIVNRIWQQHFGEGLVATSSDFGRNGTPPSHPELLDWLTTNFVQQGWSFKHLNKLILNSATWQQSAHHPRAEEYQALDPAESLLWRARVRRLQAEQIRDALLSCSGELDGSLGGPSVVEDSPRRSLYLQSFRNKTDSFLHGFDVAKGLKSVPVRDTTTTPLQSLLLINGDYALQRARAMADRILRESEHAPLAAMVERAVQLAWCRQPTADEMHSALAFLEATHREELSSEHWGDFCHVLFNSNQFLYIE